MKFVSQPVWLVARTEELQRIKKKKLENTRKGALKGPKIKISKNKKMRFVLMSQGAFKPKIRFLGQKLWPVGARQTDRDSKDRGSYIHSFSQFFLHQSHVAVQQHWCSDWWFESSQVIFTLLSVDSTNSHSCPGYTCGTMVRVSGLGSRWDMGPNFNFDWKNPLLL